MTRQKVSYEDLIKLKHDELSKKDPYYYEKVNEIISDHPHKPKKGFVASMKKLFGIK